MNIDLLLSHILFASWGNIV
uniref:Uncharacterized protein n=1 Tax=Rhizophora mucronata TaxID=61149 RepID=A0A2P2P899_RHIMU